MAIVNASAGVHTLDESQGRFFLAPMRSMDPTLSWEDQSVLFALFWRRRQHTSLLRRIFDPANLLLLAVSLFGVAAMVLAVFLLFVSLVGSTLCWAVVAICAYAERRLIRRQRGGGFPHSVRAVWTPEGVAYPHAATEMWLAGVRGGEVCKAIYLERMQAHWLFAMAFYPFLFIIQCVVFPVIATMLAKDTAMLFIPLIIGGFGAALIHLELAALGAWSDAAALVKVWKEGGGVPLKQRELLKEGAGISQMAGVFAGGFLGASVLYWSMAIWEVTHSMQIRYIDSGVVLIAGAAAVILVVIGFSVMASPANRDHLRLRAEYLDSGNFAFEAYMVAVVQQDEKDARRWASWAHDPAVRWQRFPRNFQ